MKRVLALLLAMLMVIGTPVAVLASEAVPAEPIELVVETPTEEVLPVEVVPEDSAEEEQVAEEPVPEESLTEQTKQPAEEEIIEEPVPEEVVLEGEWEEVYIPETDLPDNDQLFDNYVQKLLDESVGNYELQGELAGSRLTGLPKYFYDCLKIGMSEVAGGEYTTTEFTHEEDWTSVDTLQWTAQDLGLSTLVGSGSSFSNQAIQAAAAKANEKLDKATILQCLLADCPADLYWFDKTVGMSTSFSFGGTASAIRIKKITFKFTVTSDFASGGAYAVNATKVNNAKTAIANAQSLVEANKNKTDLEKLTTYCYEICSLVDYDHSAVGGVYGNSSQLINVFDNKTATKVVCEGYAKAFQYLCDLSTFMGDVTCYSVTGTMSGGTGEGAHMWNIVNLDGTNYLVDVTNCDAGSAGAPNKLLMVGTTSSSSGTTYKFTNIGGNTIKYVYDAEMKDLFCAGYPVLSTTSLDLGGGNESGDNEPGGNEPGGNEPGGNEPGGNEPEVELPEIEITVADGEIGLDQSYIMLKQGDTAQLTAIWNGASTDIRWNIDSGVATPGAIDGYSFTVTAARVGTTYVRAVVETEDGEVEAVCRIDVIGKNPDAAHLAETSITSNIYSTNYPTVELIFDLDQNLYSEDDQYESSIGIDYVEFVDEKTAEMFGVKAIDDRTLAIIPLVDPTDAVAVKALKSSYKSAVAVTLANGDDFVTPEVLSIKVDKKLPSVKAAAVKFNSFYSAESQPLVFTSKNGEVIEVTLGTNPKGAACPSWLTLNDDQTLSLNGNITKASGTIYLNAYVEGYEAPAAVTVKVTAAATAPKVKVNTSKVTFNQTRENTQPVQVTLISGNSKVAFEDLGITGVSVESPYTVTDYDTETGVVTLGVISGRAPIKGKINLNYSVEGTTNKGSVALTVDVYNKAPVVKLAKTSATLNPNLKDVSSPSAPTGELSVTQVSGPAMTNLTATVAYDPDDPEGAFIVDGEWVSNNSIYLSLIATFGPDNFSSTEARSIANQMISIWREAGVDELVGDEPEYYINGSTGFSGLMDTPYILFVHLDRNFNYVDHSVLLIGGAGASSKVPDAFSTKLVVTPSDYVINSEDISRVEVLNGKVVANNELSVNYENGTLTVSTNNLTKSGASYKVNLYIDGIAKPVTMSVKTVAAAKSAVKLAISAKGKIITTDPDAEVIITPKWTNYGGDYDLSENFVVYSTMKGLYTNKDVTDCFDIEKNADGTYTLKVEDLEAMEKIHPKAAITIGVENAKIGNSVISTPKPAKLSITLTKAKVNQNTKNVTLYPNDKYSTGIVALSLKDTNLPDIAYVRISETSKKPSTFKLEDLGNGMYAIGFKNNKISKAGSVKLEVFLEGNDYMNGQPNATVSVSVKLSKFKVAK